MKSILLVMIFIYSQFSLAEDVQDVYKYVDTDGATEFTDQKKANQASEQHLKIKRTTAEEQQAIDQHMEQLREKDRALDQRLAKEREKQRQIERQKNQQQQTADPGNNNSGDNYYWRSGIHGPLRPRPPAGNHPRPVHLPARR